MRPLAVLVLIVGAIAALAFAFFRLQDTVDAGDGNVAVSPTATADATPTVARSEPLTIPTNGGMANPSGAEQGRSVVETVVDDDAGDWNNFLAGQVFGPDGQLVAGAKVDLLKDATDADVGAMLLIMAGGERTKAHKSLETKEDGAFRFGRLEPGNRWSLRVSHPAFQELQVGPIDVPEEGGVQERIELDDGFVLYGRVVASGTQIPVEGARLVLENPAAAFMPNLRETMQAKETVTDANGYYELRNVTPQGKLLACVAEGYATQVNQRDTSIVGATEMRKQIDFALEEGMVIAGRVVAPDGSGVEGLRIDALGSNAQSSSRGSGVSGEGGEFLIADVAEGRYSLRVDKQGLNRLNYHVDPLQASAGDSNVEIRLQAQGGLMGVAMGADGPLKRFEIVVRQEHPTNRAFGHILKKKKFRSNNGEFQIEGLNQGTYVVQCDAGGYASSFSDPVSVEQGRVTPDVLVKMTEGGRITGVLLDAYTKEPIAGARVTTLDNNHISSDFTNLLVAMAPTGLTKAEAKTDAEGRFELPLILPDSYQVKIEKRGFTGHTTNDVTVLEGQDTDLGQVLLSKGGTVRGTAFLADGQVGAGVEVSISPLSPELGTGMRTRADAEGNFVLQNIPAGQYKIQGARPAKATESPFQKMIDMRKSEIELTVVDSQDVSVELYLGG